MPGQLHQSLDEGCRGGRSQVQSKPFEESEWFVRILLNNQHKQKEINMDLKSYILQLRERLPADVLREIDQSLPPPEFVKLTKTPSLIDIPIESFELQMSFLDSSQDILSSLQKDKTAVAQQVMASPQDISHDVESDSILDQYLSVTASPEPIAVEPSIAHAKTLPAVPASILISPKLSIKDTAPPTIEKDSSPMSTISASTASRQASAQLILAQPVLIKTLRSTKVLASKGKEYMGMMILISNASNSEESYKIQKIYSDLQALDTELRKKSSNLPPLPDKYLYTTFAPSKSEQRRVSFSLIFSF
jgi:hypothetical protein